MDRLGMHTLARLPAGVGAPARAPAAQDTGIVHFGPGNFHRAHQAVYCDDLLRLGERRWGITGVSLHSAGVRDRLAPQDGLYTVATLGPAPQHRVVGALRTVLVAPEDPQAVIERLAHPATALVTTTITEKGYCLSGGQVDREHPELAADLASLAAPRTVHGFLAAAMVLRCARGAPPLTVLCCDNLQGGGQHLEAGVHLLLARHSPPALAWTCTHVAFASSMVDRVTPATDEALERDVAQVLGLHDAAPVATEAFSQWIIEDRFAGERPPFDRVGALFVDDIAAYERVKLRLLNAGHSMLAALGYLAGDRFIHEALQRPALARFTEQALRAEVIPVLEVPAGLDPHAYVDQVLARFRNAQLPYRVLQVGSDSSQKIQQRWFPSVREALQQGRGTARLAFALAAWVRFVRLAAERGDLRDPLLDAIGRCPASHSGEEVPALLALAGAHAFDIPRHDSFMAAVIHHHQTMGEQGLEAALLALDTPERSNRHA